MISVGIIGFGRIGALHAQWLAAAGDVRATAVADATPARRQHAQSAGLLAFDNVEALLDEANVDAVLVSSPTAMHFEHASQALAARKHVMIEKPMAMDLAQAHELIDRARE